MRSLPSLLVAVSPVLAVGPKIDRVQTAQTIPGRWIAEVHQNTRPEAVLAAVQEHGVMPKHTYEIGSWKGIAFSADDNAINKLQDNSDIKTIEPDGKVYLQALTKQNPTEWGLASISHRVKHQDDYIYDTTAGEGVDIYVIDSGIYAEHPEFENRARQGPFFCSAQDDCDTAKTGDGLGHGTHVAGIAASRAYGVAKKANIIGVKVITDSGEGDFSDIMAGLEWAVNDAQNSSRRAVINMSLGGSFRQTVNDAVRGAVEAGVFVAVAACNYNTDDVGKYSPASEPTACTVGAVDMEWTRATFSNYGPGVDVYAPGVDVKSTWINSTDATAVKKGTSQSCPHIAGLAAYLIALEGEKAPAAHELCAYIQQLSTKDLIQGLTSTSLNYMVYNGNDANRRA